MIIMPLMGHTQVHYSSEKPANLDVVSLPVWMCDTCKSYRCSYSLRNRKYMVHKELAAVIVRRTRARYRSHKSRCEKLYMYTN